MTPTLAVCLIVPLLVLLALLWVVRVGFNALCEELEPRPRRKTVAEIDAELKMLWDRAKVQINSTDDLRALQKDVQRVAQGGGIMLSAPELTRHQVGVRAVAPGEEPGGVIKDHLQPWLD